MKRIFGAITFVPRKLWGYGKQLAKSKKGKTLLIVVFLGGIGYFGYSRYATYTYTILETINRSSVSEIADQSSSPRKPYLLILSTVGGIFLGTVLSSRNIPPVQVEGNIPPVEVYPSTPTTTNPTWVTLIYFGMGCVVGIWTGC